MIRCRFPLLGLAALFALNGCEFMDQPYPSDGLQQYAYQHPFQQRIGQARFLLDDFGSLNAQGLTDGNIIPIKIYFTALLMADPERSKWVLNGERDVPRVMERYGFLRPESIANWRRDLAPMPTMPSVSGFIRSIIDFDVPLAARWTVGVKRFRLEVGNITCAACHSGVTYGADGRATRAVWLGAPNTSLNIDGFFDQVYRGLKIGLGDQAAFLRRIKQAYPLLDPVEEETIRSLIPTIDKELAKYAKMDRVFNYPNGGPGLTNGLGAFKRLIHPKQKYDYDPQEAGIISIPDLSYRGFCSSLLADGAYGVIGRPRFERIDFARAHDPAHVDQLAELATFFSYAAMGNNLKNIEPAIPRVREVFRDFVTNLEPPRFPGVVDVARARLGQGIFAARCASCHGTYDADLTQPKLVSFPNRFVPQDRMGTDPYRWSGVDEGIAEFTAKPGPFARWVDAGSRMGGYVAPILAGVWYTAPYLHNGSVPTLWQLMNPAERAVKFQLGGHSLNFREVGIAGVRNAAEEWVYPQGHFAWMTPGMYDTSQPGQSNRGHEAPFARLSADEKWALIEYLKLL